MTSPLEDDLAGMRLDGRVAVVTGEGRGLGGAIAELLAARGAHVALFDRDAEVTQKAAAALAEGGAQVIAVPGDVREPADCAAAVAACLAKDLGFNMIRKHMKVEPARWYYWADKLGLLVWQDMPAKFGNSAADQTQYTTELHAMVDQHHNSPAIVVWTPFNEGWGQFNVAATATQVKAWDPSRLVDAQSGANLGQDGGNGDILDNHCYVGPCSPAPSTSRAAANREFGCFGVRSPGHEWNSATITNVQPDLEPDAAHATARYVSAVNSLQSLMGNPGLSAAVYTETTDVEAEYCGLYSYDRMVLKMDAVTVKTSNANLIAASKLLNAAGSIPPGQTGAWKFDETSGTLAADSVGSANATLTAGATFTVGHSGNALHLAAAGQYAATAGPVAATSGAYTVSAWVRLASTSGIQTAVSQDGSAVSGFYLQLINGQFAFTVMGADSTSAGYVRATGGTTPVANTWYHLVGVRDAAAGSVSLYINGSPNATQTLTANWSAAGPLAFGRARWNSGNADPWSGDIDQARVWNRALTSTEVASLYSAGG